MALQRTSRLSRIDCANLWGSTISNAATIPPSSAGMIWAFQFHRAVWAVEGIGAGHRFA
jgi:hypothetical protein